ncbi:MAG: two-component regulator propeller domain-containing protein [Coprococcus sp.]
MKKKSLLIKINMIIIAVAMVLLPRLIVLGQENFASDYSQNEFSEDEGFDSGDANCICQSESGYIWIGTDSGLYRYDGSEFVLISLDRNTVGSVYSINCIYNTSNGELYVGTENYGLFMYDKGTFNRVKETYDMGISTVNDIYEDEEGALWLGTSQGIYMLASDGVTAISDEHINNANIGNISGYQNNIYAVANNDTLVTISDGENVHTKSKSKYGIDDINSLYVDEDGIRYYGSVGHTILKIQEDKKYELISTGNISGINNIVNNGDRIWILADDGVAYLNSDKTEIVPVTRLKFNESMSDMMVDYEGNYWFTSYRKGLLMLERSKFSNVSMKYGIEDSIVNCVMEYNNQLYIGTDDGLNIVGSDGKLVIKDELVRLLDGISIRDMYVDSNNNLWICTYRIYGVIKVNKSGAYKFYNRSESYLVSNTVNCITEMSDGSMAIGTENGISILKADKVVKNYTRIDGLNNSDVISLYENKEGILYAGTNGGGIYTISPDSYVRKMPVEDGVKFNIISAIAGGNNGVWIGTENGLYYQEGVVRQIAAVDSANSIYDIIIDDSGYMWIFGSKGISRYYENDLLSSTQPESISYTKNDGIISGITERSSNYITDNGIVYVCCDEGLCSFEPENEYKNDVAPKVRISSVFVDDKEYKFSDLDGKIDVPGNTSRITVKFSVLSYVNRANIVVKYYLKGFEKEERTISGTDVMEVEYTNLEGGSYEFVLSAENADGVSCDQNLTFVINKELGFWETNMAKAIIIIATLSFILIIILTIKGIAHTIKRKNEQVEELSKKNEEAEKSNQAKNDYVNYLSHEIRVPLNTILGVSEMVMRNAEKINDEQMPQYKALYDAGYEILGMVDGISRLSNLRDGSIELVCKEYAVSDVIEDLSNQFKSMVNRDLIELKVSIEDDIPNGLIGDVARIKELVTNIFARAASTTKEGYIRIDIDWRPCENADVELPESTDSGLSEGEKNNNTLWSASDNEDIYLDFKISDTGVGVKEERLTQLFDLDDSYEKADIGKFDISLGLAIAKQLVYLMDGEISADSTYGAGTTITFSIRQSVFDYSYVNYNLNRKKELARRYSNSRIWLPDVRVLIVDESELGLQVEKTLFDTYGLVCDTVTSGFDAIDKVMVNQYDIVFMDTVMPVMDGKDTVREIRNLEGEEYRKMPIIAMSVNTVDMSREEILTSGFNEVLVKPLELDEVEAVLRMFLSDDKIKEKTTDIAPDADVSQYFEAAKVLKKYISIEDALKMMGGSFDNFNKFLVNYKVQYEEETYMLRDYIDDDVRKFRNVIHNIKSSSGNICAFTIERKAANLESAINIGNMQYARENTREFVALMKDMFKAVDIYISEIIHEEKPVQKEQKDSINRGKLKELRAYLKACELEPVQSLIADIDSYEYGDIDTEFFNALKMTIDAMDYEGASEIIDQYLNSI